MTEISGRSGGFVIRGTLKHSRLQYYLQYNDQFVGFWTHLHKDHDEKYKSELRDFGSESAARAFLKEYHATENFETLTIEPWPGSVLIEKEKREEKNKNFKNNLFKNPPIFR